ncbi:MAG: carboxypeptidase-like regulatory domain-containing protein [Gemmataceae bacterium]|nr:carboxypeptidase-like regulatory domain-containing protein [Gemmataceae bacterium]
MRMQREYLATLAVALLLLASGCGGKKPVKVSGVVTLDGKPLPNATVSFNPAEAGGQSANGRTDSSGAYQLTTYNTGDGALPGDYKVTVTVDVELADSFPKDESGQMAPRDKYRRFAEMEKKTTKPAKTAVPAVYADASKTPLKQRVPADGKVNLELKSSYR